MEGVAGVRRRLTGCLSLHFVCAAESVATRDDEFDLIYRSLSSPSLLLEKAERGPTLGSVVSPCNGSISV